MPPPSRELTASTSRVSHPASLRASDAEIATLRHLFSSFEGSEVNAHIDEYSSRNIDFHSMILKLSKCDLLEDMAASLFLHIRSIRARTISEDNRAKRSIIDHMHIIEAIERRDADLAERLAREHTLNLAATQTGRERPQCRRPGVEPPR